LEPFRVSRREAEEVAKRTLRFRGGRVVSKQIYLTGQPHRGQAPVGMARTVVLLYDGKAEWQVVVDGQGSVVSRQRTERGFRFLGYPLDYQEGLQDIETSIDIHPTQHEFLDSAPKLEEEGDKNCVLLPDKFGEIPQNSPYKTGMVVCENEAFTAPNMSPPTEYKPPMTLPRMDRDHTNPPSSIDPFGFQQIALRTVPGSNFVAPAIPIAWTSAEGNNWRGTSPELKQVAQGGWAELQAFQTIGKRATFYKSFPSHLASSPVGTWGPGSRLEIFVHQFEDRDGVRQSLPSLATTFTGLNSIRLGAISGPGTSPAGGGQHVFDVLADGSISAHEFHHHIQFVNQLDVRGTLVDSEDLAIEAEGMADVFGAVAVGRSRVGLLTNPTQADPCLGDEFPLITPATLVRSACNRNTFPNGEKPHDKGAALFGAGYNYARRLLDSGLGPASALFDLFDAEILFLASPMNVKKDFDGQDVYEVLCLENQACGIRRVLEGLILTLRYSDPLTLQPGQPADKPFAVRRRQHIALSSFAAKNMFLTKNNGTVCNVASGELCKEAALRTLSVSSVLRWNEGDSIPFFEVFAPSGTAYEHTTVQEPEGIRLATKVTFEFAQDVAFTNPLTYQQFAPRPKNNSPNGSFRYIPTPAQWQVLQTAGTSSEDRRLYFRVKVCMAENPSECVYSSEGIAQGVAPFLQFGPGAPPGGCTCRVGQPNHAPAASLSLVGLLAALLLRRRRNLCP
jgi:MYXO-CTERM domain-containing protein